MENLQFFRVFDIWKGYSVFLFPNDNLVYARCFGKSQNDMLDMFLICPFHLVATMSTVFVETPSLSRSDPFNIKRGFRASLKPSLLSRIFSLKKLFWLIVEAPRLGCYEGKRLGISDF